MMMMITAIVSSVVDVDGSVNTGSATLAGQALDE